MSTTSRHEATRSNRDAESKGPVPEANQPGHHPEVEQDKPYDKFSAAGKVTQSPDKPSSSSAKQIVVGVLGVAGVLIALAVVRRIIGRRRTSEVEQAARSVAEFVTDTVDTVKETVMDWIPTPS